MCSHICGRVRAVVCVCMRVYLHARLFVCVRKRARMPAKTHHSMAAVPLRPKTCPVVCLLHCSMAVQHCFVGLLLCGQSSMAFPFSLLSMIITLLNPAALIHVLPTPHWPSTRTPCTRSHTYQRITSHTHLGFDSLPATHSHPPPAGHNTSRPSGHGLSITAEVDPECASHPEGACEAPVGPPGTHHQPFNDPQQPRTPGQGDADGHGPGVGGTTGGGCNGGSSSGGSGGGGGAVQLQVMGGGGGTPGAFRPSSSLEDAQRRLPLPIRSLVDRLQHFDRDVMMPVFTRTPEEQQQQQQQQASQSPQQPKFTLT